MPTEAKFGVALSDLTPLQEAVITTLYLADKLHDHNHNQVRTLYVSGFFFLHSLGIVFESYHRRKMKELEDLGWLKIWRRSGVIYYGLTTSGKNARDSNMRSAAPYALQKILEDAPF